VGLVTRDENERVLGRRRRPASQLTPPLECCRNVEEEERGHAKEGVEQEEKEKEKEEEEGLIGA
jgi:hypothetical protein